MAEKLCLQWNDFQDNVKNAFGHIQDSTDYGDVTLACEAGRQIEIHKVVLAASSPFFQRILKKNNHIHPLIYMKGIKTDDLTAVVDFLYFGEANVYQENLESFLAIAKELQLKGLDGSEDPDKENEGEKLSANEKYKTNHMLPISGTQRTKETTGDPSRTGSTALALSKTCLEIYKNWTKLSKQ